MLRSMLNVRYGSGCSRRLTASAARPSACTSRTSNSATPSSGVSRPPSTAFDKIRLTVELKIHPTPGQPKFTRQHVIVMQPRLFSRPQVKVDDVRQIAPAEPGIES